MIDIEKNSLELNNDFTALEYNPNFNFNQFNPNFGNIFRIFLPQQYFNSKPEKQVFGLNHYSPTSDLVVMAMHSGALFIHPKSKSLTRRRFCTLKNFFEVQNCSESEYNKNSEVIDIPLDLTIQGVLLNILIDSPPSKYLSVTRNGIKSLEPTESTSYSLRISNFFVISMYDDKPLIVEPQKYIRSNAAVPTFKFSTYDELGINYSIDIFRQIISRFNIINGFFNSNRVIFDCKNIRYELFYDNDINFKLLKFNNNYSIYDQKIDNLNNTELILDKINLSDIYAENNGIKIKNNLFNPIDILLIINKKLEN